MPAPLPALAGSIVLKAVADLPARLFGGNAQNVQVAGLDYTLHLDLSKLPTGDITLPADNNWTVVWNADTNTYKRVEFTDLPAPASTLPGPPGPAGAPGGPSTVISGGGIVFSTRSVIPTSTIAAPVLTVQTHGFGTPGDGGHGVYGRMSAPPPNPTNPGFVQSLDGAWWRLVPDSPGVLAVEQFGGRGDYHLTNSAWTSASTVNPSPTDNHEPIMAAMEFMYGYIGVMSPYPNFATGPIIQFGVASYYVSDTLVFDRTVSLQGFGTGIYNTGAQTRIYIAAGKVGVHIHEPDLLFPGASHATLKAIHFESLGKGGFTDKHGIICQAPVQLDQCAFRGFGGNGISLQADVTGGSNANLFYLHKCTVYDNAGHGVHCQGGDANAGVGMAINAMNNSGYGIYDKSFLGNTWIGCHTDANAAGAYYCSNTNNPRSVFIGCYAEGGQPNSIIDFPAMVIGGFFGGFEGSGLFMINTSIGSHSQFYSGPGGEANKIITNYAFRPNFVHSVDIVDTVAAGHHWCYEDGYGVLAQRRGDVGGPNYWAYSITTDGTQDYGRGHGVGPNHIAFPRGIFLGGFQDNIRVRKFWYEDKYIHQFIEGPGYTMPRGAYAEHDIFFSIGDDCAGECNTQAGVYTLDVWTSGTTYGAGTYLKNSAGKFYTSLNAPGTPSTVEPTHASGIVTVGGYEWKWIANQPVKFRRFGALMGDKVTTVNDPIYNLYQTWNNAAVAFQGYKTNITDTASAAASVLEEWQVNTTRKFAIGKQGGLGAFGAAPPTAQPTVTGSRGGNAALASLLTALAATGILVDGTTV